MANFLAALGNANPLAIEKGFQDLARGEQAMAAQKQEMEQSAAMHPLQKQQLEIATNKAKIELKQAQDAEAMGEKRVDVGMVYGQAMKESPQAMGRAFKFYEQNGLIEYVDGPDGKQIPTIKMKNIKYGMQLMEQDKEMQKYMVTDRMADIQNSLGQIQAQKAEISGKKGKDTQQQLMALTAKEKALTAQYDALLTQSANLSGKGVELAEKRMKDETDRRGQDLTYKANMSRIGIESEKMRRDELDKAETQIRQLESVKQRLLSGGKGDQLLNAVFGDGAANQLGLTDKATINDALKQVDAEIDNVYSRHKSLGTRKKAPQMSAWEAYKKNAGLK